MSTPADILTRKHTRFVLWSPQPTARAPELVIGQFLAGNPPALTGERKVSLTQAPGVEGLFEIAATDCGLVDGQVYHYWFEVDDTNPFRQPPARILCTDPTAFTVDWRLVAPRLPPPYTADDQQPASVVKFLGGRLVACDPGGGEGRPLNLAPLAALPANNQLVIYELPTAWSRTRLESAIEMDAGTFRDVQALVDEGEGGANFSDLDILQPGRSYLTELGINALELLPPTDSIIMREWGYAPSHFFAPDYDLGFPGGNTSPTATSDLSNLTNACQERGIRFFIDAVMAFARKDAYQNIAFDDFFIADPKATPEDADAKTSTRGNGQKEFRDGFGSTLFRYAKFINSYDPLSGGDSTIVPARQMMHAFIERWMRDFHVSGVRMDSVENVANWDFIGSFKDRAREGWRDRWRDGGLDGDADSRFFVVGEELSMPMDILRQQRLDGLWNDRFRQLARAAIIGQAASGESFESTVRKAIDCRAIGFTDGAQAVNYLTSHDVEGDRKERLFNFLMNSGAGEIEKRIKLAFVCLLTSVGIPMILAGEEFADQHDRFDRNGNVTQGGGKQVDPVNFTRLSDPMRKRIFEYVSRLVKLRTSQAALGVNDTEFIHADFDQGKRVMAWRRGRAGVDDPVVVVANFSDFVTDNAMSQGAEYRVHNWPETPAGRRWIEISQDRAVLPEQVGREPIFAWEAKVYTLA